MIVFTVLTMVYQQVKSTDTVQLVFQKYGSTRKNTVRPVNLGVYFKKFIISDTGRPVKIQVDPYIYSRPVPAFTGRPVKYLLNLILRVDP